MHSCLWELGEFGEIFRIGQLLKPKKNFFAIYRAVSAKGLFLIPEQLREFVVGEGNLHGGRTMSINDLPKGLI
jgi:hypothetical protein